MNEEAKKRVEKELNELMNKQEKLDNFLCNEDFLELNKISQILLIIQNNIMLQYIFILRNRLKHWDD